MSVVSFLASLSHSHAKHGNKVGAEGVLGIYQECELDPSATCKEFLQVQPEGWRKVSRTRKFYNLLAAIIAVGFSMLTPDALLIEEKL